MSQKVTVHLVDDIDGGKADTTVEFGVNGKYYEIDLSDEHAAELIASFDKWIAHARRAVPAVARRNTRSAGHATKDGILLSDVRSWAANNGYKVSMRGRVSASIIDAYRNREKVTVVKKTAAKKKPAEKLVDAPEFSEKP